MFAVGLGCVPSSLSLRSKTGLEFGWTQTSWAVPVSFRALFPLGLSRVRFRLVICMAMPQRTGWYGPVGSTCLQIMDPRAELRGKVVCGYA